MGAEPAKISDLEFVFENIVTNILGFAAIVLFILLVTGGFRYINSGGDPKSTEAAQKTITYAIGGLVVLLVSYIILLLIGQITGVDLTKFRITLPN